MKLYELSTKLPGVLPEIHNPTMKDFEHRLRQIASENDARARSEAKLDAKEREAAAKVAAELEKRAAKLESIAQNKVVPLFKNIQQVVLKEKGDFTVTREVNGLLPIPKTEDDGQDKRYGPIARVDLEWDYVSHWGPYGEDVGGYQHSIGVCVYEIANQINFSVSGKNEPTSLTNPTDQELEEAILVHLE